MSEAQLAEAVSTRSLVVFAGSGLTRDAGLPSWNDLVAGLLADLEGDGTILPEIATAAKVLLGQGKLAASIQVLLADTSRAAVARHLRARLTPTAQSRVVDAIRDWKPKGIVTTNYDRETDRVVSANCYRLTNSESDLKLVPTAIGSTSQFAWKVHGDIDDELEPRDPKVAAGGPFMVLSSSDFATLVHGNRGRQLAVGLMSVLQSHPVAFVGYSFADPDIASWLNWISENVQFTQPTWFVGRVGDTGQLPNGIERLHAVADWSQLSEWMANISQLATRGQVRRDPASSLARPSTLRHHSTYLAVGQYLTSLESSSVSERVIAAILFEDIRQMESFTVAWMDSRIAETVGVGPVMAHAFTEATLSLLASYSAVSRNGDDVLVRQETETIRASAQAAWARDRRRFFESVIRRLPSPHSPLHDDWNLFETILIELSSELGESMAEWVTHGVGAAVGLPRLKDTVARSFSDDDEALRQATAAIELVLSKPTDDEIPYLHRLLAATFLANSVRLNPIAGAELRQTLPLYELYLDANVILPLVVVDHPNHESTLAVVSESIRAGVAVAVITPFLEEVAGHREVARRDLNDLGGDPGKVAEIVGALGLRTNVFLQGYARSTWRAAGPHVGWQEYLGRYTDRLVRNVLDGLGVKVVVPDQEAKGGERYALALTAIRDEWFLKLGYRREDKLNQHEAAQMSHIYSRRLQRPDQADHIWFLSTEAVLQRVFERQPSVWALPATFPYSAWAAYLDSRMPNDAGRWGSFVRAILRGRAELFDLPSPVALVREKAFGTRVTSRAEEEALRYATSDFALMKRVERAQQTVMGRRHTSSSSRTLAQTRQDATGEVSSALDAEISRLSSELVKARQRIVDLESPPEPRPDRTSLPQRRRRNRK